jgi:phage gpG-like protein
MATVTRAPEGVALDLEYVLEDAKVQELLTELARRGRNLMPAMKKIAAVAYRDIAEIFQVEGKPEKWAPLRPLTIMLRRKGKVGGTGRMRILRDTGRGFASVTSAHAEGAIYEPKTTDLILGTRVRYMAAHMTGLPARHIPLTVRAHQVRTHFVRIEQAFGRTIHPVIVRIGEHTVRQHIRNQYFGPLPKRVFIQWSDVVIEKARHILADELLKGTA